ncbi:MAG: hypothetical protein Ct9H90mP25_5460 [Gammaproteobacteria bacterium]|nr:MAG: hypothetical protein Ct9H90mP25_5460 [Gammaproteobacteria bacterium]
MKKRHLVDGYTESVRNIERRIQKAEEQIDMDLPELDQPAGVPPSFEEHMEIMQDLQVLALQTDLTRVFPFMMRKGNKALDLTHRLVSRAHHPLSHHNNNPVLVERMSKINTYHTTLFSKYLDKLSSVTEGDGTFWIT